MIKLLQQKRAMDALQPRSRNRAILGGSLLMMAVFSLLFNTVAFREMIDDSLFSVANSKRLEDQSHEAWNSRVMVEAPSSKASPTPDELFHPYDWDDENGTTIVDFFVLLNAVNATTNRTIMLKGVGHRYIRWWGPIIGMIAMHEDPTAPESSATIQPNVYFSVNATSYVGNNIIERIDWIRDIMLRAWAQFMNISQSERMASFPSLTRALNDVGSFPAVWWLDDQSGCYHNAYMYHDRPMTLPLMTFCNNIRCKHTFHIPDWESYRVAVAEPNEWDTRFAKWEWQFPVDKQVQKAQWRGSCTGLSTVPREQRERYLLDIMGKQNPDLFDTNSDCDGTEIDRRPAMDHLRYRAVLDVDGNAWTGRFARLLCSTTVVVKIIPRSIPYYWHTLIPGYHYLPATVEHNPRNSSQPLGNLTDVVRYAVADENRDEVQAIAKNAQDWCRTQMIHKTIYKRFLQTMNGYVELLDRSSLPNVDETTPSDEIPWHRYWREHSDSYLGERSFAIHGGYTTFHPHEKVRPLARPLNIVTGRLE